MDHMVVQYQYIDFILIISNITLGSEFMILCSSAPVSTNICYKVSMDIKVFLLHEKVGNQ